MAKSAALEGVFIANVADEMLEIEHFSLIWQYQYSVHDLLWKLFSTDKSNRRSTSADVILDEPHFWGIPPRY